MDANADTRGEKLRELELKLILGSNCRGWNISENIIAEKNLVDAPWEFGYALGASRPLGLAAQRITAPFAGEVPGRGRDVRRTRRPLQFWDGFNVALLRSDRQLGRSQRNDVFVLTAVRTERLQHSAFTASEFPTKLSNSLAAFTGARNESTSLRQLLMVLLVELAAFGAANGAG